MANSALGDEIFVTFRNPAGDRGGAPEIPQEITESEVRAGVDGVSVILLGKKCVPFQMESGVDVSSFSDAMAKQAAYNAMVGQIKNLIWNGREYLQDHGCRYVVLHVSNIRIIRLTAAVGGLQGTSGGQRYFVRATWDLIAFEVP